jgi:hypothetical protein
MEPVELHYAAGRLWRTALFGLLFLALALWLGLDPSAVSGGGVGRGARFARAIGPEAFRALALALALLTAGFLVLHLRLSFARGRVALKAAGEGLTVRSYFGERAYKWPDVEAVYLRQVPVPTGEQTIVMVRPCVGRESVVAVRNLAEDAEDAAAWVDAAERLRTAAQPGQVT